LSHHIFLNQGALDWARDPVFGIVDSEADFRPFSIHKSLFFGKEGAMLGICVVFARSGPDLVTIKYTKLNIVHMVRSSYVPFLRICSTASERWSRGNTPHSFVGTRVTLINIFNASQNSKNYSLTLRLHEPRWTFRAGKRHGNRHPRQRAGAVFPTPSTRAKQAREPGESPRPS
jgi:hypothetical protein